MPQPGRPALLVIFGPPAVGKMTVGQELAKITGFRLLHNHRIIDLLTDFFEFGSPAFTRVVRAFLDPFMDAAAEEGLHLAVTIGWRLDDPEATRLVERLAAPFLARGGDVCFAELEAPLEVRLERNASENRRLHKKVDWSTDEHLAAETRRYRWNTDGDFPFDLPHIKVDNSALTPAEAAEQIKQRLGL